MSDRVQCRALRPSRLRVSMVGLLLLLAPVGSGAQTAAEYRRRLDSLEPQFRAARATVEAWERARRVAARAVVLEYGPLRLLVDSSLVPLIAEPASLAARDLERTFGDAAHLLASRPFIVREQWLANGRGGDSVRTIRIGLEGREQGITIGDSATTRYQLLGILRGGQVTGALHAALDDSLRAWFRAPLHAGMQSSDERRNLYVGLVTASTDVSRRCLAGDLHGCRQLLGLAPVPDPLMEGHTAVQRRAIAVARAQQLRNAGHVMEYDRCVAEHDDAACIARLRTLAPAVFARSMTNVEMHRSFALFVLERGKAGAYERLRATHSPSLDTRFAAAGGAPADTLIAAWRAGILAARPLRSPVSPVTALATLAWIIAGGALALRSSRWR